MIKTGNPIISIYTEMTPNPETMKFVANKLLYPGKSIDFQDESQAAPSPLAKELFSFPFIKSVFIASNFVTLTKTADTEDWQDVIPSVKQFLKDYLENGGPVINEDEVAKMKQDSGNIILSAPTMAMSPGISIINPIERLMRVGVPQPILAIGPTKNFPS